MSALDLPEHFGWQPTSLTSGDVLAIDAHASNLVAIVGEGGAYRVVHSVDAGQTWSSPWLVLPGDCGVTALVAAADGVYVGFLMRGVVAAPYYRGGERPSWRDVSFGLPDGASVSALAASTGEVYVGTRGHGVYVLSTGEWRHVQGYEGRGNEAVTALAVASHSLIVGGPRGLVARFSGKNGRREHPCASAVTGLQTVSAGGILGWSPRHVCYSDDGGATWLDLPELPLDGAYIRSAAMIGPHVFVGLQGRRGAGILRWAFDAAGWEVCTETLPKASWSVIVFAAADSVLAGYECHGMYRLPVSSAARHVPLPSFALQTLESDAAVTGVTVRFRLHRADEVRVELYGENECRLRSLALGTLPIGEHEVTVIDGSLGAGVYTCTISAGGFSRSVRRIVLR